MTVLAEKGSPTTYATGQFENYRIEFLTCSANPARRCLKLMMNEASFFTDEVDVTAYLPETVTLSVGGRSTYTVADVDDLRVSLETIAISCSANERVLSGMCVACPPAPPTKPVTITSEETQETQETQEAVQVD